jgi:hypothetical protein
MHACRYTTGALEPDALEVKDAPSHIECMAVKCAVCSSYSRGEEGCQQVAVDDLPAEEGDLPHLLSVTADGCAKAVRRKVAGSEVGNTLLTAVLKACAPSEKITAGGTRKQSLKLRQLHSAD